MLSFWGLVVGVGAVLLVMIALPAEAQIFMINSPPELSLPAEPPFNDNGADPNEGGTETDFTFRVRYRDIDGDGPEYVRVCFSLPGKYVGCYNLTVVTDDQDSQKAYEVEAQGTVRLSEPGTYTYYFRAYDGQSRWGSRPVYWPEPGERFSLVVTSSGYANVAFIPGFQASRLYKDGMLGEDRLWEPTNRNEDARDLMMGEAGVSVDPNIYTRDIIDETYGFNIYKDFMEFMDGLAGEGTIADWQALPYDWRISPREVAERGVKATDGTISYFSPLPADTQPYMIETLEELADSSANGKVTIIAHSSGGLVAKALIDKLVAMQATGEGDLITRIDRLIMVGTPQLGTPKALAGLLHGDEQNLAKGFILTKDVARELGENMPGAYSLLPSDNYFAAVADPVIEFAEDVRRIYDFGSLYGDSIDSEDELRQFLRGDSGRREEPAGNDTDAPNVLNSGLLQQAQAERDYFAVWQPPEGIEVVQVAGWGLDTIRGIKYDDCDFCLNPTLSNLDREPISTYDGDETVVVPSAVAMPKLTYFVNLYKHNREFVGGWVNRDHASLMEVRSLHELIEGIISGDLVDLPSFITTTKPPVEEEDKKLRLRMHSPVSIDIEDSAGNHTGITGNPYANSDIKAMVEQIPNSTYLEFGETAYVSLDMEDSYMVSLTGEAAGIFTLEIEEVRGEATQSTRGFYNVPVMPAARGELTIEQDGSITELSLDFDDDGTVDATVPPGDQPQTAVTLNVLRQLIVSMDLYSKVDSHLLKSLNKAERALEQGKQDEAVKELDKMIEYLEKEAGKYEKQEDKDKDKENKYIITADADVLIEIIEKISQLLGQ